jgi:hypothetical protein
MGFPPQKLIFVIIEHEGQNVVHVPAEVIENVSWATQALEETA